MNAVIITAHHEQRGMVCGFGFGFGLGDHDACVWHDRNSTREPTREPRQVAALGGGVSVDMRRLLKRLWSYKHFHFMALVV